MFSVTGVPESVFYIALAGIIIVPFRGITAVTEKMLDGMGKSFYELLLTLGSIIYEISIVYLLLKDFDPSISDDINTDLKKPTSKISFSDFKKILNNSI